MIGLTIGTGTWYTLAQRAAARMEAMTGIKCSVIDRVDSNLVHSSWHKLNLLRDYPGEALFIFDADMWCMKEWDPMDFAPVHRDSDLSPFKGLAMVPELPTPPVIMESRLYHIPVAQYHNGGLIIADERAKPVFAAAKKLHPNYGSWLEQTPINHVVAANKFPIVSLPRTYNTMLSASLTPEAIREADAVNVHFAGRKTGERLHEIYDALT